MPVLFVTLRALTPLFLLIVLGYGLKRARVLHVSHVPVLNGLVVKVTMPALVILGLTSAPSLPRQALALPAALLLAQVVVMGLAWSIGRLCKFSISVRGALMVVGTFGNTGFLGYPMTLALHPAQFPEAILMDQFGMTIALYLCTPLIGAKFGSAGGTGHDARATVLRFFRSPIFLALMLGTMARLIPWPPALVTMPALRGMGEVFIKCLTYLGQGTTPLVLLALGTALRPGAGRAYVRPLLLASTLKLLVCPVAMWLICRALGLHGALLAAGILSSAMPTSVMASVLSSEHDLEGDFAVSAVFGSTLLAAATVPLVTALLR